MDMQYGKGYFLIANPVLPDPNFSRTVVLICNHNEDGSFGLVVNRSAQINAEEVFSNNEIFKGESCKIFVGGPVSQTQVFYLCRSETDIPGLQQICPGVQMGMNRETLEAVTPKLHNPSEDIRFYLGYSGWAAGQLEGEMERKSWLTCKAEKDFVFGNPEQGIWPGVVRSLGKEYEYLLQAPINPSMN
tara:strand:+ start:743 stop:1306 length:564 start_codon:yes stop_codon:yes gene_type:complete